MSFPVNPMQLIQMIRQGQNPQQLLMHILEGSAANNPMSANLLQLAKGNKTAEIEKIARNFAQTKGIDYDQAFNAFRESLGFK